MFISDCCSPKYGLKLSVLPLFWVVSVFFITPPDAAYAAVNIWEESITLPSYEVAPPERLPRFYEGRVYQGAQGRVYPYPLSDRLTDKKIDKTYTAVYLENEYIQICVLPEIGGRIFSALDKTNDYDFFYRQSVIKPALIGMLGAWISGGVEWNFPHHHRSRTFMPMDYALDEHEDGSATLWLGEIERRHRMRFLVGLTLHPGRSYLEATVKIINRTPFVNSFLYFANPAVHVDETYQVIFPPETEYVTQHAKREFSEWPISNSRYGGRKYNHTDISWWKNLPKPVSFFCWNPQSDFFAGYDHGKDAGVAYVSNHHIAPGMKFFTFGCGNSGAMWDKMLTDTDGPYLELMAGAYSDNQPDYSWIQPYETKIVQQYWYPIRNMGGLKYANLEGAVNLELASNKKLTVHVNTTAEHEKATLVVSALGKTLAKHSLSISPKRPYTEELQVPSSVQEKDIELRLFNAEGKEILHYTNRPRPGAPRPQPVVPPPPPSQVKTIEELYLAGLRLDQFHNAKLDPSAYYEEALRRDAGDSRVNTQLGILYCKRGMYEDAAEHLTTAIQRLSHNYTRPRNGEAYYYLGIVRKAQGRFDEAYDAFYRASWSLAWQAAAYFALAELDCLAGDFETGLEHVDQSLVRNSTNSKAHNLRSAILRKLHRYEEARRAIDTVSVMDPLDYWMSNEHKILQENVGRHHSQSRLLNRLTLHRNDRIQTILETAVDYGNAGFWDEAIKVLEAADAERSQRESIHPLVAYYQGSYWNKKGDADNAKRFYQQAVSASPDYCFPFRLETIPVLEEAMAVNPNDSMAPYYLGNFFYDRHPQKAIQLWEEARKRGCPYYVLYRNLGYAYNKEGKTDKAVALYEKAIEINPKDARLFYEMDRLYEKQGKESSQRLAFLDNHAPTIFQRDDVLQRYLTLLLENQRYDRAVEILSSHHFHTWEGGGSIHGIYADAYLLRGWNHLENRRYEQAIHDFETSMLYPDNLEVAQPAVDETLPRAYTLIAQARLQQGNKKEATRYFEKSIESYSEHAEILYYKALAYNALGQNERASELFEQLVHQGKNLLTNLGRDDFFAKFGRRLSPAQRKANAHYIMGLGYLGQGEAEQAQAEFTQALSFNPNHYWVYTMMQKR